MIHRLVRVFDSTGHRHTDQIQLDSIQSIADRLVICGSDHL